MTEKEASEEVTVRGQMFYDGTCRFCTAGAARVRPWLAKRKVEVVPFENGAAEAEMKVTWHDGRIFGGADAAVFLARQFWFTWPLAFLASLPGFKQLTDIGYRFIARNRHCINGACEIDFHDHAPKKTPAWTGWLILALLVAAAAATGLMNPAIPAWLWMWMLAGSLWIGFKWMNFTREGGFKRVSKLFAFWIGTDAAAFRKDRVIEGAHRTHWKSGTLFVAVGLVLLTVILPRVSNTIVAGWVGVTTMLCVFHFGSFALLAAIWRRLGFGVEPIMRAPWMADSLAEFWGPRWNRAFSDWGRLWIFRPLFRKLGLVWGTLAGFFASGIAHEIVVSLPARGGFGLPTIYFMVQGIGVLAQRKFPMLKGHLVTLLLVLLPAPILFHPPFIREVFVPMTDALLTLLHLKTP